MNYLTEFDLYIDMVLIVYIFCAKIFLRLMRGDSKKGRCPKKIFNIFVSFFFHLTNKN